MISEQHKQSNNVLMQSGLGIASFSISITAGVLIFILFIAAVVVEATTPAGVYGESGRGIIVGLLIMTLVFADIVALGLGLAGLAQRDRRRILAAWGTICWAVAVIGTVALIGVA